MPKDRSADSEDLSEKRRGVYELLRGVSDADALHDLIVQHGPEILDQPIPYLVTAARHRRISNWRHAGMNSAPLGPGVDRPSPRASFWDPAERVAADEELRQVLSALTEMDDRDVLVLWRHVQGASDDQILDEWKSLGFDPSNINIAAIRKRRSRARVELREAFHRSDLESDEASS